MPSGRDNGHLIGVLLSFVAEQRELNQKSDRRHGDSERRLHVMERMLADLLAERRDTKRRLGQLEELRRVEGEQMSLVTRALTAIVDRIESVERRVGKLEAKRG